MSSTALNYGIKLQTTELQPLSSYSIRSLRRFVSGKKNCIILNPGYLSNELTEEIIFRRLFSFEKWDKFSTNQSLKEVLNDQDSIVLLDHTGSNDFSTQELELINQLKLNGRKVYSIVSFYEHITGRIPLVNISKGWLMNNELFFVNPRLKFFFLKRTIDIIITLCIILPALVLSIMGMLLMKLSSKGPALFTQKRVGKNGKIFTLYKIRTMFFSENGHHSYTVKNDERVTPVGKFLRITKIDELPQLINLVKGEMSLIGPRPEKIDIVAKLVEENPYYNLRHTIKPGISGWAQVNNPTATPDQNLEKLEYDLYYLKNMSIFLDLRVLWRTAKVVLTLNSL